MTYICVSKLSILGSDNGLSPGRRQAIIETNAGILVIWPLGIIFSEILIDINTFLFKKMHLKMSSGNGGHLSRPQCVKVLSAEYIWQNPCIKLRIQWPCIHVSYLQGSVSLLQLFGDGYIPLAIPVQYNGITEETEYPIKLDTHPDSTKQMSKPMVCVC